MNDQLELQKHLNRGAAWHLLLISTIPAVMSILTLTGLTSYRASPVVLWICCGIDLFLLVIHLVASKCVKDPDGAASVLPLVLVALASATTALLWSLLAMPLLLLSVQLAMLRQQRRPVLGAAISCLALAALVPTAARYFHLGTFAQGEAPAHSMLLLGAALPETVVAITVVITLVVATFRLLYALRYHRNMSYVNAKDEKLGIYNKSQFHTEMKRLLSADETPYLLIVTDLIQFRVFNDYFGYDAGDRLLKNAADLLLDYVGGHGIVGRLRDDHLLVLVERSYFNDDAFRKAFLQNSSIVGSYHYTIEVVCGVYEITDRRIAANVMCDCALIACHDRKAMTGGISVYREAMMTSARQSKVLLNELNQALNEHQFIGYIQPQCDKDGNMLGGEVLARWRHPERGIVMPGAFITSCEENGLISRLDREMWESACRTMADWDRRGLPKCSLSVNISPIDLYEMNVLREVLSLTERFGLSHDRLRLEITESSMMKNSSQAFRIIHDLRAAGFTVEMDDFGSSYSSLGTLSEMEVDVIKLDTSFLHRLDTSPNGAKVLQMMANLAASMGVPTIVEGVETQKQLELLVDMGYENFQGMYFSGPISADAFEAKYLQSN